jgi:3-oxoacyl-(acyl-carrier-protein) synthase
MSGNKPICILAGWGNATDAFHQTASSPDGKGAALAMTNAIGKKRYHGAQNRLRERTRNGTRQ